MIKIAIVVSQFNTDITKALLKGTINELIINGVDKDNIHTVTVPGAIEIPLTAKLMASTKRYQAIICLGVVIRGETNHYDYVCQQVSYGCMKVMLDVDMPIIFGILTTENELQAKSRVQGELHKGVECAKAALAMVKVMDKILL